MQEIIVGIIVMVCLYLTIRAIIQFFKRINHSSNPCDGCNGCELKNKKADFCGKSKPKVW